MTKLTQHCLIKCLKCVMTQMTMIPWESDQMRTKIIISLLVLFLLISFGCMQPTEPLTPPINDDDSGIGTTVDEGDTGGLEIMYKIQPAAVLIL